MIELRSSAPRALPPAYWPRKSLIPNVIRRKSVEESWDRDWKFLIPNSCRLLHLETGCPKSGQHF